MGTHSSWERRKEKMASAVFILNLKGQVLISRNYKGDVPMSCVDQFMLKLLEMEASEEVVPVFEVNKVSYMYVTLPSLYLLAVTKRYANVAMVMTFLHRFAGVLGEYFNEVEEESVRDNFKTTSGSAKEALLRAHFGLSSLASEESDARPPIKLEFEIPYFTVSGCNVRYVKIIEASGYQASPWIRYLTKSGQ